MTDRHDFDLLVIGGGSAGVRCARMAAQRGAKVALVEAAALGGTCVNVGCIPKKLYSYAAGYGEGFVESAGYGWEGPPPSFNWDKLKQARAAEIRRLNGVYGNLLKAAGVTVIEGWAKLDGPHHVVVDKKRHSARHIVLATGGMPHVPDVAGREHAITSEQMFDLAPFPKRLAVVGGGYIACEMASIFHALGAEVTLLQRGGALLAGFDGEVRRFIASEMGKAGIEIKLNWAVEGITRHADGSFCVTSDSHGSICEADVVLYATGRKPLTAGLGLEEVGVKLDAQGAVVVDGDYRSSVQSVYAIGDISSSKQLTPVALAEAMALVDTLFGDGKRKVDYEYIPTAVFTHPNIGTVGRTEEQARSDFDREDIEIYRADFRSLRHTLSGSQERCFVKLVVQKSSDRVLGLHMVGPDAGEIVQGFAVAMRAGATKALFDTTIGVHPTLAEEFVTLREPAVDD
ncbi:glutathione-disulfide reductase [Xylophilus rhododendri]|uniref:Glutathione-disulfide reductase n=1 Tax=Xylophilus rhododendri TaxID=2697032 RepID=A0A857J6H0_9BURK|nr:glutathione-disulfide reductase [Xylophilus rhododendri]QHI98415.1 glutathione-disulfide reductase [Xylophilus rhododendri]